MENIDTLYQSAKAAVLQTNSQDELENIRVSYLGKKGRLTEILKGLSSLSPEERPRVGQQVNQVKQRLIDLIEDRTQALQTILLEKKISQESCDVTLPGKINFLGASHPVTQMVAKVSDFFVSQGFDLVDGPEIESDFYNFEALNIPSNHPARMMHDTFYFGDGRLLRTHTSPVQIRAMQSGNPPFRLIAPGKVYRCDSDLTHTPMFHQIEGLFIDKTVTFCDLKATLQAFLTYLFETQTTVRFRPSYFPFTEPSAEVDMQCSHCQGMGCRICKNTGWIEVGGCGMVHPSVLKSVNIDSSVYQGWAFGMGIDRLTMIYHGIDDLRALFENDMAFLKQFK